MEKDLQMSFKGVEENLAKDISLVINATLVKLDETLDFRRMHQIIITADFAKELAELSSATASGSDIQHTNEEYAIAVAKVLLFQKDNDLEIVPVINANIATHLVQPNEEGYQSENFHTVFHLLHHELCHVHDNNKKIDAFPDKILRFRYEGKDRLIRALAEACWSEYIANVLSSSSAHEGSINAMGECFSDAIERTKEIFDKEILDYRYHGDIDRLMSVFERHGEFLVKSAAYMLGYMEGCQAKLEELYSQAAERLKGSYFETTWIAMRDALTKMKQLYPSEWKDLDIYDELAIAMEDYYAAMGLILLHTNQDGGLYIDIPFRPETTPPQI